MSDTTAFLHGTNGEQLATGVAAAARAQQRCAQSDVFGYRKCRFYAWLPPPRKLGATLLNGAIFDAFAEPRGTGEF